MMRKFRYGALAFFLCIALLFSGCGPKDLTKGKTPQEIVLASGESLAKVKSYGFTMNMDMGFPNPGTGEIGNITMKGTGSASMDPLKMHLKMTMNIAETEMQSEIYAQVEDKKIVEYISNPQKQGEWIRFELPLDEKMMDMLNPAKSMTILKDALVDAKVVGEEEKDKIKLAVLEITIKPEAIGKFLQMPGNNLPLADLEKMLASLGNMTYKMWVQKDNLLATKVEMDMGEMFRNLMKNQPGMPPEMAGELEKITAKMTMEYTDFDKAVNITIPEDVKSKAQDMSGLLQQQQNS